jgi:putative transposase
VKVAELALKHGISPATFYQWKAKYCGPGVFQLRRLKELEAENAKLKKMYAELSLNHEAFKDSVEKKRTVTAVVRRELVIFMHR